MRPQPMRDEQGWWRRIVLRADFRPDDPVLLSRGGPVRVRHFSSDRPTVRFFSWCGFALWAVIAPTFALGMPVIAAGAAGLVHLPRAPDSFAAGTLPWRIATALFALATSALGAWQVLNLIAYLRFRLRSASTAH